MITSIFAGLLAILYFKITLDTIKARRKNQISLGSGQSNEISAIVSAHRNFNDYVPLFLILIYLIESQGFLAKALITIICVAFSTGRYLHFEAFTAEKMNFKKRVLGMHLTLWPLLLSAVTCIGFSIKNNLF